MNANGLQNTLPGMPAPPSQSNIAADDWDELFLAVEARLRSCVGQQLSKTPELQLQAPAVLVEAIVLECVAALDQLHAALKRERLQRRALVIENFTASNQSEVRNGKPGSTRSNSNLTTQTAGSAT